MHFLTSLLSLLALASLASGLARPTRPDKQRDPHNPGGADKDTRKYFKEPGGSQDLGHYDLRYFKDVVSDHDKDEALKRLVQAFLSVFRTHRIEVWLAHGTLLGWWWNGRVMPWDWDLDVQVSHSTLAWLAREMNGTRHTHVYSARHEARRDGDDDKEAKPETPREFLLDINPHYVERVRGDGMNFIDGRFIDTSNGLFVDITGLSETRPEREPGVWRCKNNHKYVTREIYPLRETEFEGATALVPFDFDTVLQNEYSSLALTRTEFNGHIWDVDQKQWVVKPEVSNEKLAKKVGMGPWKGQAIGDLQKSGGSHKT